MSSENTIFLKTTKDIFLTEPLTYEGRKALRNIGIEMTEKDFYNEKIYVEPFSEYKKLCIDSNSKFCDPDTNYNDTIDLNVLNNKKVAFENKIKELNDSLFVIKAVAGSGKTTYLHKLKQDLRQTTDFNIHNFENVKQSDAFMGTKYDLNDLYISNVYRFISMLMHEISQILSIGDKTNEEHHNYINSIVKIYKQFFQVSEKELPKSELNETNIDNEEQTSTFDILEKYVNNQISYYDLSVALKNRFFERFTNRNTDCISDLSYIASFIIRLYFCISKIHSKKQLCVVDNIEIFVKYDEDFPIQENELEKIIVGFNNAARDFRGYLIPIQNLSNYKSFFGFLIVTRDTTASTALLNMEHYDDYKDENEIDISNWYCTEDIYENKRKFFEKKGKIFIDNCYSTAYKNILHDFSVYRWGLNGIISKMYKHSHRRNIECIPDAIAVQPKEEIEYFNLMWYEAQGNSISKSNLKSLCRKYVLRILIDHVQRTAYFDKLMVENNSLGLEKRNLETVSTIKIKALSRDDSNSYARKISTLLHNFALDYGEKKYISFQRLIDTILRMPYLPVYPTDEQIENLAKILFLMNETRNSKTNWTSLVCIKYDNNEKYCEEKLVCTMKEQWNQYLNGNIDIDDSERFGVRITEAGSFFAKILSDFEYFACRFLPDESALFSKKNINTIIVNGKKSFRAVEIIKIIRKKAFSCVDEIIHRDYIFFASTIIQNTNTKFDAMYNGNYRWLYRDSKMDAELVHPYRILEQHIGYISNYISYVTEYISDDSFNKPEDKIEFIDLIKVQLQKYIKKRDLLLEKYPEYFKI